MHEIKTGDLITMYPGDITEFYPNKDSKKVNHLTATFYSNLVADKGVQVNAGMVWIAVTIGNSSTSCGQAINAHGVKGHKLF